MRRRVSHFPATRFLLQPRLTSTSHPSYLFLPSSSARASFGVLLPPRALQTVFSGVLRLFFLNSNPYTCLGKCSSTFPVVPRLFFFSIRPVSLVSLFPISSNHIRGRIMGIKPLPSLREAFSEVRCEESRKKVMMGSKEQPAPTLDASALAARSFNSSGGDRQKRDRPWCDCCKKLGHYKEACWKLHGKPADWKPKPWFDRDGGAHVAANSKSTSVPEPSPFNKEQMEMLQKLLSQVGSGSTTRMTFTANRGGMKPWIVDTGASDHMTRDAAILQNYKPSNGHSSVHIADGSKSKIAGTGSIKLTKGLYLDSVLHVPNLDYNLLSISKLARDLQCVAKFYPNSYVFQDLKSGKMIGSAELCSGLYLLPCGQVS
ncbi:Retrovirus-related Pol polyprotein from transposon RE2 [Vitis vinifera]|uniref:Retrovirus-related Pol polyprotein from transposon RE2 n=1 Tax=Vitis vinifera TaxID=29760 RepID=A0A438DEJ7_VITVI|nr:Retrovirus-related Pol polyprotein from transposon RE2 [Vitis vinifera]